MDRIGSQAYTSWLLELEFLAAFSSDFLGSSTEWMLGSTPPWAMVTCASSLLSSSSFLTEESVTIKFAQYSHLMASWRCLGMILRFLLSLAALLASSRISAARYSMTAAM